METDQEVIRLDDLERASRTRINFLKEITGGYIFILITSMVIGLFGFWGTVKPVFYKEEDQYIKKISKINKEDDQLVQTLKAIVARQEDGKEVKQILNFILFLLSGIVSYLVYTYLDNEKFQKQSISLIDALKKLTNEQKTEIIYGLNGVQIKHFKENIELQKYLTLKILSAKKCIEDLTWKLSENKKEDELDDEEIQAKQDLERAISKMSKIIPYREVFIFNDNSQSRKKRLERILKENNAKYSCKYFPNDSKIPRIQFMIIDEQEIVFASSVYPFQCSIRHKDLVKTFKFYFNEIWRCDESVCKTIKVKGEHPVEQALIKIFGPTKSDEILQALRPATEV